MIFVTIKITLKILKGIIKAVVAPIKFVVKLFQRSDVSAGDVADSIPSQSTDTQSDSDTTSVDQTDTHSSGPPDSKERTKSTTVSGGTNTRRSKHFGRFYKGFYAIAGLNIVFILYQFIEYSPTQTGSWLYTSIIASVVIPLGLGYWINDSLGNPTAMSAGLGYSLLLLIFTIASESIGQLTGYYFTLARPRLEMLNYFGQSFVFVISSVLNFSLILLVIYSGIKIRQEETTRTNGIESGKTDSNTEESIDNSQPSETSSAISQNGGSSELEEPGTTSTSAASVSEDTSEKGDMSKEGPAEEDATTSEEDSPPQETSEPETKSTDDDSSTVDVADPDEVLDQIDDPPSADDVQQLATSLTEHSVTDKTLAALNGWANNDDPDVRIAVCEACAAVEDSEAENILQLLRIDSNDRVMRVANDAL